MTIVAAVAFAIVAAAAERLVAQGAQASRETASAPPASHDRPRVEPARTILRRLAGVWRFEIWFAGNFDDPPDASGTRVVRLLLDELRVEWTEELDHSPIRGHGVIGFDLGSGRFFSASASSVGSQPALMTGTLDPAEPLITFSPASLSPGADPGSLILLDADHFTWAPLDRGWRAVFTRQEQQAGEKGVSASQFPILKDGLGTARR